MARVSSLGVAVGLGGYRAGSRASAKNLELIPELGSSIAGYMAPKAPKEAIDPYSPYQFPENAEGFTELYIMRVEMTFENAYAVHTWHSFHGLRLVHRDGRVYSSEEGTLGQRDDIMFSIILEDEGTFSFSTAIRDSLQMINQFPAAYSSDAMPPDGSYFNEWRTIVLPMCYGQYE